MVEKLSYSFQALWNLLIWAISGLFASLPEHKTLGHLREIVNLFD